MGRLVVIEGLDGAGKRTLSEGLTKALHAQGASVATLAFPRYGRSVYADLVREALHRGHGDLADSVYGMAMLYALDRRGALGEITGALERHDVLLLDRYVASNAAYGAARLHQDAHGEFIAWLKELEIDRFGLPVPDLQLLLRVTPEVAAARAEHRARSETDRAKDSFESDDALQARCARVYDELAGESWLSEWRVVDGTAAFDPVELSRKLVHPG
ncbi:dTMP kinase [Amycolatopsis rhizosphaerae]|uniref:dTMP kinase n=1 Tax=Amycolatopsis rhizosphaerae TaxID=2053003 RepID=UPI001FE3E989|nr:dTMP kinase [Amycolatopsis rhizosphaerae]